MKTDVPDVDGDGDESSNQSANPGIVVRAELPGALTQIEETRDTTDLSKIRDLLFGEQARDTDKRLQELEWRVYEAITQAREESSERLEALGRDLNARLDGLQTQIADNEANRRAESQELAAALETARGEISGRIDEEVEALDGRILESHQRAIDHIDQAVRLIDEAKMGREALAELFLQAASKIREP